MDLATRGYSVYGSVRREVDAENLRSSSGGAVTPVMLDVTDQAAIDRLQAFMEEELVGEGLHGLVNNAGMALAGPLELVSVDAFRQQMEVNVTGQLAVTQAMMPLIRRARGRIIMMSSVGGRSAVPFVGPYCASKFALEAMTDALRVEVAPWDIRVSLVEPASIKTSIWSKSEQMIDRAVEGRQDLAEQLYGPQIERMRVMSARQDEHGVEPEVVAEVVRRALASRRPKTRYLVGGIQAFIRGYMQNLPDRLRDRAFRMLAGT